MKDETLDPTLPGGSGAQPEADTAPSPDEPPPRRFSKYRLLEKIGEGGMGEVWAAEQLRPVRRRVALKVIKKGMDSKQVVARFETERQALAMMDHPNIAKVLDGGTTPRGRPYFVMEFVKGIPITRYCDKHKLDTTQRLDLFLKVCDGVQHAHQKAIIHRDLKPSNLLVSIAGDEAVPKIIDFGVAKATSQRLTEKTMFTELGQLIGTPEYMSPEQAEMSGANIDTRTDVYALGVVLYELLVGALPFDSDQLRASGFDGIRQRIREVDPLRPSTRLSRLGGDEQSSSVANRHTDTRTLASQLRGDLDWITMKALEKDRTRRYGSPAELADDIRRYLNHEPVLASPPSAVYKMRKFVRRHRFGVASAAVLLMLLIGFAVTMAVQAGRIARERDRANQEAETARQVSDFMTDLFEMSDPSEALGNTITVREVLDQGAYTIRNELKDQPVVQARLMGTIGEVYRKLGLYDQGRPLLEESLRTLEQGGGGPLDVSRSLVHLGLLMVNAGEYEAARPLYLRALEIRERELSPQHADVAAILNNLGTLELKIGNFDAAQRNYRRSQEVLEAALGPGDPGVARVLVNLAITARYQRDPERARTLYGRALEILERAYGPDHPDVAQTLNSLAELLRSLRRYDEARPMYERALAIREKVYGDNHPAVAVVLNNLGIVLDATGDHLDARRHHERALAIREARFGAVHDDVAQSLNNLAIAMKSGGDYAGARRRYERARDIYEETLGRDHPRVANAYYNVASAAALQGDRQAAIATLRQALDRGFANRYIYEDDDFASLRDRPEFREILAEVQRRLEAAGRATR